MTQQTVRSALERVISVLNARPDAGKKPTSSATAVLGDGLSCKVTGARGESANTDMPKPMGGDGGAPTPGWYLNAAIASCAATGIAARASLQGIELDAVEVTVDSQSDTRGLLGIADVTAAMTDLKMNVVLSAKNASAAELEALVSWVEAHSPVSGALRAGSSPAVEVITPSGRRLGGAC
jgi:uncharacterized OsmC-like protein